MSSTAPTNTKTEFVTRVVKLNIDTNTMRAHQHQLFRQYSGATRAIYNWAVSEWRNYKKLEYDFVNQLIINHIGTDNPEKMSEFRKDPNNKKLIKDFYKQYEPKEPNGFSLATKLTEGMKDPEFPFYWNRAMPRNGQKRKTRAIPVYVTSRALANYNSAVQSYYRTMKTKGFQLRKNGIPVASPQYKSKGNNESFGYAGLPTFLKANKLVVGPHRINLPYVGTLRTHTNTKRLAQYISSGGVPKSALFTYTGNRWYVAITVSVPVGSKYATAHANTSKKVTAGDLGVNKFLATSHGTIIPNMRLAEKETERIKKLQQKLSTLDYTKRTVVLESGQTIKEHNDPAYPKTLDELRKAYHKLTLHRQAYLHQLTKQLATTNNLIILEDLNVAGMLKAPKPKPDPNRPGHYLPNGKKAKAALARSISDVAWSEFIRQIEYKTKLYGSHLVTINPAYTSLTCNQCGNVNTQQPEVYEIFVCEQCQHVEDRDVNAAKNILKKGMEQYAKNTTA